MVARAAGELRLGRGAFIGYLVLSLTLGLVIGVGLLLWQRSVLLRDIASLEKRLSEQKAAAGEAESRASAAESQLTSATALVSDLTSRTDELTRLLNEATTALAAEKAKNATGTVTFSEHSSSPSPLKAGKSMTLTVKLMGKATKVVVKMVNNSGTASYNKTFTLKKASTASGVETWRVTFTAPKAGSYKATTTGYVGTKTSDISGPSGWTLTVE